jgi:shikimate kinase
MVFAKTGRTIRKIVETGGWQAFREVEKTVIAELSGLDRVVISLGGGAVMNPDNVSALKKKGRFVWLQAVARILALRMNKDLGSKEQRPSLTGAGTLMEIERVLTQRLPVYRAVADVIVDTAGKDPAGLAAEIAGRLGKDRMDEKKRMKRGRSHVR